MQKRFYNYPDFHLANLGYSFIDAKTDKILPKLHIYLKYTGNQKKLNDITNNEFKELKKVDSNGWIDGVYLLCNSKECEKKSYCFKYRDAKIKCNSCNLLPLNEKSCDHFDAKPILMDK
jgi:ribosomal protein S27E